MIFNEVYIPKYNWTLRIYYAVNHYHTDEIIQALTDINCPGDILNRVFDNLQKRKMDSGFTYSKKSINETVMVIGIWSDKTEFMNSFSHEIRHLIDDIGDKYNIDSSGENIAYLTGDVNQALTGDVQLFLCDCNHCHNHVMDRIY